MKPFYSIVFSKKKKSFCVFLKFLLKFLNLKVLRVLRVFRVLKKFFIIFKESFEKKVMSELY